jgi:catechol 2,3-dioxygenase-like lactoylglutathione lyase family enzyme
MGILVKDLENTCRDYEQILGFRCIKNPTGSYSGSLRSLIIFGDESLLEFLSPPETDSAMNNEYLSYMRDFLNKHEGAMSLALESSSAKDAAEFLREKDFEVRLTEWPKETEENIPRKTPVNIPPFHI